MTHSGTSASRQDLAIRTKQLTKNYGSFQALHGLDLSVKTGEVHGFLGPNGAGKSTTIRILLGILRKTAGEAQLLGGDPWDDAVELHKRVAYVPGDVNLWPNLTGGEVIDFFCRLSGEPDKQRLAQLLERFELDPTKKCRTYSKGNRQKVAIVAALASEVELFILDEPTSGLDPLMETVFQDCIKELKAAGKTVLLSSHILAEAEALCDRLTIIREGKAVESGSLEELRHLTRMNMSVEVAKPLKDLGKVRGVHNPQIKGTHAEFEVENEAISDVLHYLSQYEVKHFVSTPPSLEKLFMRHYGDKLSTIDREEENL